MKIQEALLAYQYANVGQFRGIAEGLGYRVEYNKGDLRFVRDDDEFRISTDKVRTYTKHEPDLVVQSTSMERICKFFDREQALLPDYKKVLSKEGVTIINWGDLKNDAKDRFTIIDHTSKIAYTGEGFYDYALQNGYLLDGKGTQLEKGQLSDLTTVKGKQAKIRLTDNGVSYFYRKEALVIPDSMFGKKLTKTQKKDLAEGRVIVLSSKKGDLLLQVDRDLNSVIIRTMKELAIPQEIGGYKLTPADKYLLANGFPLCNKIVHTEVGHAIVDVSMTADKRGYAFSNIQMISANKAQELLQQEREKDLLPEKEIKGRDLEAELKEAVGKSDYEKMADLRAEGYKPSEKVIEELVHDPHLNERDAIVIEKLFGQKPEVQKGEEAEVTKEPIQEIAKEEIKELNPEVHKVGEVEASKAPVEEIVKEEVNPELNNAENISPIVSPEADLEIKSAIEKGDFSKLSELKERGYQPSKELMQSLSATVPGNTLVAVQTIFGLKKINNSLGDVKLAQSGKPEKDLVRPVTNTINRMFTDL